MSKATLSQFSFNRGELDPVLHGRSDWKYYFSGAEKLLNVITRAQGGAVKRGGLRLVAEALDDNIPSFLIPFRFSVKQSYMLEFGHFKMRVIKDNGVVVYPGGHAKAGQEVVIATPFAAADLPLLRYAQTADVMIFTHADYPPKRLMRYDHHDWRFDNLITNARTEAPANLEVTLSGGDNDRYVVTAVSADKGESFASNVAVAVKQGTIAAANAGTRPSQWYDFLVSQGAQYYIPAHLRFFNFGIQEISALLYSAGYMDWDGGWGMNKEAVYWSFMRPPPIAQPGQISTAFPEWMVIEVKAAMDLGQIPGAAAAMLAGLQKYVSDYNDAIYVSRRSVLAWQPVAGAASYKVYRETEVDGKTYFYLIGETAETTFYDDRLAATLHGLPVENEPFSGPDDYPGVCAFFEQRLILGRSNRKPNTFWGSDTGIYNSFGRHTPIEDSDSYEFTLNSGEVNEVHWITPLNDLLLGTSGGEWKAGGGGQAITPKNINARIQSWYGCSPLNPVVVGRSVLFAGRSRQNIRNFSYSLEADGYAGRDLAAYSNHLFAGRKVVSMCHQQEPSGIVWVVMSDGALLSCTYSPDEDVVSWSRHETAGRFENCSSMIDIDGSDQIYFCVAREVGGRVRRFIESLEEPSDRMANETDAFFVDSGLTYCGKPTNRVANLDHLEGLSVSCLADGNVYENLTVSGGAISLPDGVEASVIHAGLPYRSELTTLELEPENGESLRNRPRFVVAAVVRFHNTRECFYACAGGGFAEMKFRTTESPGVPTRLFTGEKTVSIPSSPGARSAKLTLASTAPVPFGVLGIIAEASCGQPA